MPFDLPLTAEDEAALERAWQRIEKEEQEEEDRRRRERESKRARGKLLREFDENQPPPQPLTPSTSLFLADDVPRRNDHHPPLHELPPEYHGQQGRLTDAHKDALRDYMGPAYRHYNLPLRLGLAPLTRYGKYRKIRDAFRHVEPFAQPLVVWRGVDGDGADALLGKLHQAASTGKPLRLRGFTSASFTPRIARKFAKGKGIVLEIHARHGLVTEGLHSLTAHERELLFDHDSRFRVHGVKLVPFDTSDEVGPPQEVRMVVQMEQVPQEGKQTFSEEVPLEATDRGHGPDLGHRMAGHASDFDFGDEEQPPPASQTKEPS